MRIRIIVLFLGLGVNLQCMVCKIYHEHIADMHTYKQNKFEPDTATTSTSKGPSHGKIKFFGCEN